MSGHRCKPWYSPAGPGMDYQRRPGQLTGSRNSRTQRVIWILSPASWARLSTTLVGAGSVGSRLTTSLVGLRCLRLNQVGSRLALAGRDGLLCKAFTICAGRARISMRTGLTLDRGRHFVRPGLPGIGVFTVVNALGAIVDRSGRVVR